MLKLNTLLSAIFVLVSFSSSAQYPEFSNAGFEDWEVGVWNFNPVDWDVMNSQLFENTFPDSSAYEGEVAMQVFPFNFFEAAPGLAFQVASCDAIPPTFNFAVKCNIEGQDSVKVQLIFSNNGLPVYITQWASGESIETWQEVTMTLNQIEPVITDVSVYVQAGYGEIFLEGSPETWISVDAMGFDDAISVSEDLAPEIEIYPNPASEQLYVKGVEPNLPMVIYDENGKIVAQEFTGGVIDVSQLKSGVYLIDIARESQHITKTFIVR
ncbi:MAG: T9SS type A sorting domain-containing protein [Flavobacteriales bacterium]|nr:T9SS type A sorting domain-containing protein [Flavobacteriales bacterium]